MIGGATLVELVDWALDIFGVIWGWICLGMILIMLVVIAIDAAGHPGRRLSILWGYCRAMAEPVLVWSIFILQVGYIFITGKRLLGLLFPWPVATGIALAFLILIVRSRRRRRLSSARMWRYVFYAAACWGFYSLPLDAGPEGLSGFSGTFVLVATMIGLIDLTSGSSAPEPGDTRQKTRSDRPGQSG